MKPLLLAIGGLHSFKDVQVVDFKSLTETGLFGIFGPTGSGKSTILDAITLALYGQVARAGARNQGILNHGEERVFVAFTFQLSTTSGVKQYRVERVYRRTGSHTVSLYRARLVVIDVAGETVLAEKSAVTGAVEDLLGLSGDDFTRAVVLPQGKFAEFLSLKPKERRQMLQRIFSLQEFGDSFVQKLKIRLDKTRRQQENLWGEQEGLGDASHKVLAEIKESLSHTKNLFVDVKKEKDVLEKSFSQIQHVWQLQQQLIVIEDELEELTKLQGKMEEQMKRLALHQKAQQAMPFLHEEKRMLEAYHKAKENWVTSEEAYKRVDILVQKTKTEQDFVIEARKRKEPLLLEQKTQLIQAVRYEQECIALQKNLKEVHETECDILRRKGPLEEQISLLGNKKAKLERKIEVQGKVLQHSKVDVQYRRKVSAIVEALQAYQDAQKKIDTLKFQMQEKEQYVDREEAKYLTAKGFLDQWQKNLEQLQKKELEYLNSAPDTDTDIHQAAILLEKKRSHFKELCLCQQECKKAEQMMQHNQAVYEQQNALALREKQALKVRKEHWEKAKETVAAEQKSMEEALWQTISRDLAAGLKSGEPCPICGSLVHPRPFQGDEGHLKVSQREKKLQQAKALENKMRDEYEKMQVNAAAALARAGGLWEALQKAKEIWQEKRMQYKQLAEIWQDSTLEECKAKLESEEKRYKERMQALDAWKQRGSDIQLKRQEAQLRCNEARVSVARAEEGYKNAQNGLLESKEKEKAIQIELKQKFVVLENMRGEVEIRSIMKEQQRIELLDLRYGKWLEKRNITEKEGINLSKQLSFYIQKRDMILQELAQVKMQEEKIKQRLDIWQQEIYTITLGNSASKAMQDVEQQLMVLRNAENQTVERSSKAVLQKGEAAKELAVNRQAYTLAKENLNLVQEQLKQVLEQTGFSNEEEVLRGFLAPGDQEHQLYKEIESYQEQKRATEQRKKWLTDQLQGRVLTAEAWQAWQNKVLAAQQKYEQVLQEQGAVEKEYEKVLSNHMRWRKIEKNLKKIKEDLHDLELLEKLFRGNAFVEYLAEEQLASVARDASVRLGKMTHYRYALEVDSEGGFIVRDDGNGGVKRPVSTLSGGEIFVTSLSLALALSAQIQLKGCYPLEFFFLDEGFGTLDPELLEAVITSLEQLRQENLTIGVISHVAHLKNRMPRRLLVQPAGLAGEGSRLYFEMS